MKSFKQCVKEAQKNYESYEFYYDGHRVPGSFICKISWENPKENIGYGGIIKTLFTSNKKPMKKEEIQIALNKKPTSSGATYRYLVAAQLIKSTGNGYVLTDLGNEYAQAWLGETSESTVSTQTTANLEPETLEYREK